MTRAAHLRHVVEASSTEWGPAFCVSVPQKQFNSTRTGTTRRPRFLHVCLRLPLFTARRLGKSLSQALASYTTQLTTCLSRRKDIASLLSKGKRQPAGSDHGSICFDRGVSLLPLLPQETRQLPLPGSEVLCSSP